MAFDWKGEMGLMLFHKFAYCHIPVGCFGFSVGIFFICYFSALGGGSKVGCAYTDICKIVLYGSESL